MESQHPITQRPRRSSAEYDNCKPPVVIARKDLDKETCATLLDALVAWVPDWDGVYGALKPFFYADVLPFFHDLRSAPGRYVMGVALRAGIPPFYVMDVWLSGRGASAQPRRSGESLGRPTECRRSGACGGEGCAG